VFEEVDEDRGRKEDRGALDSQIRAVNELLEGLKRQRGAGGAGGGGGGGGGGASSAVGAADRGSPVVAAS
jgi:hypothetical protein